MKELITVAPLINGELDNNDIFGDFYVITPEHLGFEIEYYSDKRLNCKFNLRRTKNGWKYIVQKISKVKEEILNLDEKAIAEYLENNIKNDFQVYYVSNGKIGIKLLLKYGDFDGRGLIKFANEFLNVMKIKKSIKNIHANESRKKSPNRSEELI
jgi:hypothetical protein